MATGQRKRVVILGAGFAGLHAARALRRVHVDVVIVDRTNFHLFQPLLYQVATGGLSPAQIASPIRGILRGQDNARVLLGEVLAIRPQERVVELLDGELHYDYLVVATGAENNYFGRDAWRQHAPGLKTIEDALECRRRIFLAFERAERATDPEEQQALLTFVIVGGGPTGVELAGAIQEIATEVMRRDFRRIDPSQTHTVIVDAGPRLLAGFDPRLSDHARQALEKRGVEVLLRHLVRDISARGVCVGERWLEARTVIWAAGVRGSPLAGDFGQGRDHLGRLRVEPDLSLASHPEVFVVGDLARFELEDGGALPGLAPVAVQQGHHAAVNIASRLKGLPPRAFHYRDRGKMATIGRASAVAEIWRLRIHGVLAWLIWLTVHLLFLIGFRNRLIVLIDWAYAYLAKGRSDRLMIDVEYEEPRRLESQPAPA